MYYLFFIALSMNKNCINLNQSLITESSIYLFTEFFYDAHKI